tara:strand:+ start:354 stop:491 length:138 start_codon:yes stop_codon:yes gene_type:complete
LFFYRVWESACGGVDDSEKRDLERSTRFLYRLDGGGDGNACERLP